MKTLSDLYYSLIARFVLLKNDTKGQTLVEYALIVVVISLAVIAAMILLRGNLGNTYNSAASQMANP